MKRHRNSSPRKLTLDRERVRALSPASARAVAGGTRIPETLEPLRDYFVSWIIDC
jgi:hypothetical protein